jgi:hypothetical protein
MSFKSFSVQTLDGDRLALSDPQPLVFSGRHGLIARFVLGEPKRAASPWKLCPGELHALAFASTLVRDRLIAFEESEETKRSLMWLQEVQGISGARTEMLFSFAPLIVEDRGLMPVVCRAIPYRIYREELVLDGGVFAPTADWRWTRSHLALGGVVLGQSVRRMPAGLEAGPPVALPQGAA